MTKERLFIIAIALGAGLGAYILFGLADKVDEAPLPLVYENQAYGISFSYPDTYQLEEQGVDVAHNAITLMRKEDLPLPSNGEGPPSITTDMFTDAGVVGVEAWVRESADSNFQFSPNEELTVERLGGAEVATYTWDGLYSGESVVFAHGGNIVMFSVTYHTYDDEIRADFLNMLDSVVLNAVSK